MLAGDSLGTEIGFLNDLFIRRRNFRAIRRIADDDVKAAVLLKDGRKIKLPKDKRQRFFLCGELVSFSQRRIFAELFKDNAVVNVADISPVLFLPSVVGLVEKIFLQANQFGNSYVYFPLQE